MLASPKKQRQCGRSHLIQHRSRPFNSSLIKFNPSGLFSKQPQGVRRSTNIRSWNIFCRKPWQIQKLSVCPTHCDSNVCSFDFVHESCGGAQSQSKLKARGALISVGQSQEISHSVVRLLGTILQFYSTTIHSFEFRRPENWDVSLPANYTS